MNSIALIYSKTGCIIVTLGPKVGKAVER